MKRLYKIAISVLFVVTVIGMIIYVNLHPDKNSLTTNIFDEMYYSTVDKLSSPMGKSSKVEVSTVRATSENMDDTSHLNTKIDYSQKSLTEGYQEVSVHIYGYYRYIEISFSKNLNKDLALEEFIQYHPKKKYLEKRIGLIKSNGSTEDYIDDKTQIKKYLKENHITPKDLDNYYDQIVNKKILTDWCSVYDSKFSPKNYGKVKIETQWENW